jgi:hypothetical protein
MQFVKMPFVKMPFVKMLKCHLLECLQRQMIDEYVYFVNEKNMKKMSMRINGVRTVVIGTKDTAPLMQQD